MSLVGNLEDLGLGEILQIVSLSRKSGILSLRGKGREGKVVFRQGLVVRASSSIYQKHLGGVLVSKGIIDSDILKKALRQQERGGFRELLGRILVSGFGVSYQVIEGVVREQIEKTVYSLFALEEGNFDFELQENIEVSDTIRLDPLQFMLDQGLNPQYLAMEGSRLLDEMRHRRLSSGEDPKYSDTSRQRFPDNFEDFAFDFFDYLPPGPGLSPAPQKEKKPLLLLVDEDHSAREALVKVLERRGYDVVPFEKGGDALVWIETMIREGRRLRVIVDLIMPRTDGTGVFGGIELLRTIHEKFPAIPAMAMADCRNSNAERQLRKMGYSFIRKPGKEEIGDNGHLDRFADSLDEETCRLDSGKGPSEWSDKVDLGDELRFEMGESPAARGVQSGQSTGIAILRRMMEELYDPALAGGIILLVLRFASEFMNRAVVLFVKRDEIIGLGQFGIDDDQESADSRVRSLKIPRNADSLFNPAIDTRISSRVRPYDSEWNRCLFSRLGGGIPVEVFTGPIVSEGKVVAVLYGDNLPEITPIGDIDVLDIFLSQAGMAMEKAFLLRRLQEKSSEVK